MSANLKPITSDGGFTTVANIITGNLSATGNGTFGTIITSGSDGNISGANVISANIIVASANLTSNGLTNLGPVGNVTITGGSNGQVLTTDGSNVLSWTTVSGGGSSISNGNSNVDIATVDGNVTITSNGAYTWTFDDSGNIRGTGSNSYLNLGEPGDDFITLESNPDVGLVLFSGDATLKGNAYIDIIANTGANSLTWRFDSAGNLTLPANTFSVNYANGTQVSLGGGNTGNVTFSDQIVIGTGDEAGTSGLYLATGPTGAANLQYLQVRGGDVTTHIHLDTGNNLLYDQFFGNDYKYLKLSAGDTGNVVIGTDDGNGNLYSWTFDSTGNLTLPTISLGASLNEQTYIQSQRKVIPPYRWSVLITGSTPTLVYTAKSGTVTLKTTIVVQSSNGGFEMFDVAAAITTTGTVVYSVGNRLNGTGQPDTTAVVDTDGSGYLAITLTINSGATTSYVTYDSTEFGIAND